MRERIPRGRVVSYGDIAGIVGIGPRQVGAVMSRYGGGVTWWRVTNAAGHLPEHLLEEARAHWFDEGIPVQAGSYSIYTVPGEKEWTVIVNRSTSQWGIESAYTPEVQAQEVGRARVPSASTSAPGWRSATTAAFCAARRRA